MTFLLRLHEQQGLTWVHKIAAFDGADPAHDELLRQTSLAPALPAGRLGGTALLWEQYTSLKVNNLIEATLLPDTLPYRVLTDSAGNFRFEGLPAGTHSVTIAGTAKTSTVRPVTSTVVVWPKPAR